MVTDARMVCSVTTATCWLALIFKVISEGQDLPFCPFDKSTTSSPYLNPCLIKKQHLNIFAMLLLVSKIDF